MVANPWSDRRVGALRFVGAMSSAPVSSVPMWIIPVWVMPIGTAPIRRIPTSVPVVIPGGVPAEMKVPSGIVPSDVESQMPAAIESPTVVARIVPYHCPDVFGIGSEQQGRIKVYICIAGKPPITTIGGVYIPIRIKGKIQSNIFSVGNVPEALRVLVDNVLNFI